MDTSHPSLMRAGLGLMLALIILGCGSNPYRKSNRLYKANLRAVSKELSEPLSNAYHPDAREAPAVDNWIGSYHFNLRRPNFVIIHHTAQESLTQTIHTFTVPHTSVSSHYVIGRDGTIVQMVNDYLRSWHAGAGSWGNLTDLNSASIGIELDNNGNEPFPEKQISSLLTLLDTLKIRHKIPTANFLAHSDTAPTRKQDPSVLFPWETLANHGFGFWPAANPQIPPDHFQPADALRIIGYDVSNLPSAIIAFKRRYIQNDLSPVLSEIDLQVLYQLYLLVR